MLPYLFPWKSYRNMYLQISSYRNINILFAKAWGFFPLVSSCNIGINQNKILHSSPEAMSCHWKKETQIYTFGNKLKTCDFCVSSESGRWSTAWHTTSEIKLVFQVKRCNIQYAETTIYQIPFDDGVTKHTIQSNFSCCSFNVLLIKKMNKTRVHKH